MKTTVLNLTNFKLVVRLLSCLLFPLFSYSQTFFGVSSSSADGTAQTGTTVSITPPGSMATGDLVVIYALFTSKNGALAMSATGGQSWTTESSGTNNASNLSYTIFWCRFNGTWSTTPSVTDGATASGPLSATMYVYRPTSSSSVWGIDKKADVSANAATTISIAGVTAAFPNTVTMAFWSSPATNTWGSLTNTTEWSKTSLDAQNRNTSQSYSAAYNIRSTAGAVASVAQTQSTSEKSLTSLIGWYEIARPANDQCANAFTLSSNTNCTTTSCTLNVATTYTATANACGTNNNDVWYSFVAKSPNPTITLTGAPTDARAQIMAGDCTGGFAAVGSCPSSTTTSASGLTVGATYYVRVYSTSNASGTFTICITDPPPAPSNDLCLNALPLTSNFTCTTTSGTLNASTTYTATTNACGTNNDVWYSFVAQSPNPTITLGGTPADTRAQIMSGTCTGGFAAVGSCPSSTTTSASGLTVGATYYVRVFSNSNATGTFTICITDPPPVTGGRMNEVYRQTTLSAANVLDNPWEVTYGPDNYLWITEAKGYKVYRMDPNTGAKTTVLDLNSTSTDLSAWGADSLRAVNLTSTSNWNTSANAWPQGGLAGLALHPDFLNPDSAFVYISYVHRYLYTASGDAGIFFRNKLVRFTYNSSTGKLGSPVVLCDTLPGGQDHNSQRMIIAPVVKGGKNYLFYAQGDMGAGQFSNKWRTNNAQNLASYEGKILRFNLVSDKDSNPWIPNDNPYSSSSAVYSMGIRNNQGFAYDSSLNILYGSSHGPFSDDEINIIKGHKNYGHPLVIGYSWDGNVNGTTAGAGPKMGQAHPSSCPIINDEADTASKIPDYQEPLFSAYPNSPTYPSITTLWNNTTGDNSQWPSEGWSGLDLYTNSIIPGWKHSLVASSLKWGRLVRMKLNSTGDTVIKSGGADTVSYFGSTNRYRDIAFAPNGKDIYVIMDRGSTTSGPSALNPIVPACPGCLQKYTFLGYRVNSGSGNRSYISNSIDIAPGKADGFETANKVVINAANGNTNLWVPITDSNSNIVAEIYSQGRDLDTVTTTIYTKTDTSRLANGKSYLNRNLTISPQKQPGGQVLIRLYISKKEFNQLVKDGGVGTISGLKIIKNEDSATTVISSNTNLVNTSIAEDFGSNGFVLQGDISGFSSFYFASDVVPLPLQFLSFKGALQNNAALLQWETANEVNTSHFVIERSIDGSSFNAIGTVAAAGHFAGTLKYSYLDNKALLQSASKLYYRLKQVDENGSFSYSKTIAIDLNSDFTVTMHPNPITDVLKIRLALSKAQKIHISVTDMSGRSVYNGYKLVSEGNNELQINTKSWPAQVYSVKITGSDSKPIATQNVIKL
ncbi:PQQ-dependent sugar dehydrogenase [Flavisolibacter tropicus]|uniref:Glucose/Sorbosone dehydrogenase domain-containing protein n=1 Tax=Flavisolibacter tropicus TaxID=1492898 RepID=A0A172TZ02_9BACT|nr:PQQ-dependent sugar dehydrogenase [Flavisolibacter tropicus]ANE52280.1 hypothetical protein SY85_19110 [Flavisolibacter tropicus]